MFAYPEDHGLTRQLLAQGRKPLFRRVTAASEIITAWGRADHPALDYAPHDRATAVQISPAIGNKAVRSAVLADVAAVDQWDDDFPYYSDGSWSAVSLRGFYPGNPRSRQDDVCHASFLLRRAGHDDLFHTCYPSRDGSHQQRRRIRSPAARRIDPDPLQGPDDLPECPSLSIPIDPGLTVLPLMKSPNAICRHL